MSRVGKSPITIVKGVEITVKDNHVTVKGPKGVLEQAVDPALSISIEENTLTVLRSNELKDTRAKHGLYRALIANMIEGVTNGFKKEMELVGVGYRANTTGQQLELMLGFSHPIIFQMPSEISVNAVTEKGKNPIIILESHDKQLIGQVAAKIRSFRTPEPYKGKGIRFKGEFIRRKAGKSAAK